MLPATIAVELTLFAAGLWLWTSVTRARDRLGRWASAGLAALLLLIYAGNVTGPPPPSSEAVAWVGAIGGPVLVALAAWVDRRREPA